MSKKDSQFMNVVRTFDQKLLKYVQSYLLPAFNGMKFGSPKCDYNIDDEGTTSVNGIIFDPADNSTNFHYTIAFYPKDDKTRVSITKFTHGHLCSVSDFDHWNINEANISSKDIKDKFLTLTDMEQKYFSKHHGV